MVKTRKEMNHLIVVIWASLVSKSSQLACQDNFPHPEYTDIFVKCGMTSISLAIPVCPVIYAGYNESLLILNQIFNKSECTGILDESTTLPVVRFTIPLNMTSACGSTFLTTSAAGTGIFADFSEIHTVNVSGLVRSHDPATGKVTYNVELKYYYSCAYPMEYLINNTQVDMTAASIAVTDNHGSFISTLSMELFSDATYTTPLVMPQHGLELKTRVHVQVKASNLTTQYLVLMNRCYASTSPYPINSTFINLFVLCSKDDMTNIHENGVSHRARFSFLAFRFAEQQKHKVSIYYLHCISRLCEHRTCNGFKKCHKMRKRDVDSTDSNSTTLLMLPLVIKNEKSVSSSPTDSRPGLVIIVLTLSWTSLWL